MTLLSDQDLYLLSYADISDFVTQPDQAAQQAAQAAPQTPFGQNTIPHNQLFRHQNTRMSHLPEGEGPVGTNLNFDMCAES